MPTLDFAGNPLVNDDRNLPSSRSLDFFGNPVGLDMTRAPAAPLGLQGMPPMQPAPSGSTTPQLPALRSPLAPQEPTHEQSMIYYSPSTGDMVVNGFQFNQRNASQALVSRQFAAQPHQRFTLPDTASDWRVMPQAEYAAYMNTIENPSFGRRMGESWENAWRGMGDIAIGAGLAIDQATTGDEDNQWLLNARASLTREYEENAPFMMQLRDVENVGDAATYFAQMLVQGAPWLVETAISMGVGGLVGGAVSGGVGAPAGAVEAFIAKEALRSASRQLLRQNLARGAEAYTLALARRQGTAALTREEVVRLAGANADDVNRFFNFSERAYHMARPAANGALGGGSGFAQAGQVAGMGVSNYLTGVGDIRNSIADAGGDTESADAVANIWGLAIPYAFVESMGDLLVTQPVANLLPGFSNVAARSTGLVDQLAARGSNALRSAAIVGPSEGLEEGAQYLITQQGVAGATNRPIDIEPMDLLESVVGGALAGAGLGGATGAMGTPGLAPPVTPAASTPAAMATPGPVSPEPVGGLDLNYDPSDDDPNYVGYQEQQAMRNNAIEDLGPTPYSYDGEGDMGGLDLNQDPTDTPNNVSLPEEQAMRNNAIMDVGPTTVTPPTVTPQVQRTAEEIFMDLEQGKPIAPQEFQIIRDAVRQQQMRDPTNPAHTDLINYINDVETEQNSVEPAYDWTQPELQPTDGLPAFGPHRLQAYRDKNGKPTGKPAPEYVDPVVLNTDKLGITRDHMGRTKGISASMVNEQSAQAREDYANRPRLTPVQKKNKKRKLKAHEESQPRGGFSKANAIAQQTRELERRDTQVEGQDNRQAEDVFADAKAVNVERHNVVDKFGAASHNEWLKNFRKNNPKEAKKPRMRERGGAMVDINQPWDKLDSRAKADNATAAEAAYDAYKAHPDDIEAGSAMIHDAWVKRNKNDKSIDKALLKPYAKLSEEEKEKDRAHWRRVQGILNPPKAKPKRNRLQEVGDRIREAKNAVPERSTEATPAQNKPRVVQETVSRDTADTGTASKGTDSARDESVPSTEVTDQQFTDAGVYENERASKAKDVAKGYGFIAGTWRQVTEEDVEDAQSAANEAADEKNNAGYQEALRRIEHKWEGHSPSEKLANSLGSDYPAVTKAEALRAAKQLFITNPQQYANRLKRMYRLVTDSATEVNQARVDKAIAALMHRATKRGASMKVLADATEVKQHAAALASNLSQSDKAVAAGKKPFNIDHDKYAWYFNNNLNRADLKAVIEHFKAIVDGLKADKPKASPNAKRAQAFHSQVMEEWNYARTNKTPQAFADFVVDPKYREEVQNWVDTETVSMLALKVRNTAKEILEASPRKATDGTDEKPKRGTNAGNPNGRPPTTVTTILREVLAQDPRFTLNSIHPATRERNKAVVVRIHEAQDAAGEERSSIKKLEHNLTQLKKRLANGHPKAARGLSVPANATQEEIELSQQRMLHGSPSSKITKLRKGLKDAVWLTTSPRVASSYSDKNFDSKGILKPNSPTVYMMRLRGVVKKLKSWGELDVAKLKSEGYIGYATPPYDDNEDLKADYIAVFDPENIEPWFSSDKPKRAVGERLPRKIIDVRTPDGPSKIYVNPTRDDVMRMTKTPLGQDSFKYDMVRFVADANGNVFAGNGYYFIHDQIVDVVEDNGMVVNGYEADNNLTQDGHGSRVVASSVVRKGDKLQFGPGSTEETMWPKRSTENQPKKHGAISESYARKVVDKIQRMITKDMQFKTVHVMKDVVDIFKRGNDEIMIAPNGAKVSLMGYVKRQAMLMKNENPELKDLSDETVAAFYIQEYMQAHAFVIPGYKALFVFTDYIQDEGALLRTLEHEYIVHGGFSAIFSDILTGTQELDMFLQRFGKIPGVEKARLHLLATRPEYGVVDRLRQLEEVLAFHAMHGPLALEALLSAEEGIDQETRRSLWEDFKDLVKFWLEKVFGIVVDTNNAADLMDDIVAALREHAIVGTNPDLMSLLDRRGVPQLTAREKEDFYTAVSEHAKRAVGEATTTAAETQEKLMGTKTNPLQPYRPRNYVSDTLEMLEGNEPLIEKLTGIRDRNVGTPIKEALRKIGRELVSMNDMALKSVLIEKMMRIMHNTIKYARNIMTRIQEERQYMSKSAKTARIRKLWGDKFPGSTPEQLDAANHMMLVATNNRIATLSDAEVRGAARLRVRNLDGTYTINTDVYKKMLERGTLTIEEFYKGVELFTVDKTGKVTSAGVANLSKEVIDIGYEIYANESRLMAESALKTLEAWNEALSMRNENSIEQILRDVDIKEKDQPFVREALLRMRKLYADIAFHNYSESDHTKRYSQQEMGYQVMVELQRAFHEELKVKDWTDSRAVRKEGANPRANDAFKWRERAEPHKDVAPFVDQIAWFLEYDDTLGKNRMEQINSVGVSKDQQFDIMNVFQALINAETQAHEVENDVIQSIMGNYVEMSRNGEWRVALEIRDANGKEFTDIAPQFLSNLPTTYAESKREAIALQNEWAEAFSGLHTIKNLEGKDIKVTFDVSLAMAPGTKTMGDAPKVREFLKVAELAGMTLKPHQMKVIANLIESASTRKRLGLQRAGTPGADINVLLNNSQTMTRRAWQAAKTAMAHMLESTMTDRKNQTGDWDYLAQLQQNFDNAKNSAARTIAEQRLLRYAEQLRHMARHTLGRPTVNVRTTKGELKLKITGEAEAYNVHAQALKASLEKGDIEVNLNDMLSKTGALRQMAVVSQLGTIAAGIMNAFTPLTHLPWRLMASHDKTGYGEAFNLTEISAEIISATSQVGNLFKNLSDSVAFKKMVDDAKAGNNNTGLTLAELEAMYQETLNGVLMPQQTYSLTGGTESNISNLLLRNLMTMFLGPFSAVEASTRRISFLTAYRLMKARYIAAGVSEDVLNDTTSPEYKQLMEDIERVVFDTQGDYSNVNRPRSFRGDWAQYILQYKMFPLNTVLLIKNLPKKEQAIMLGVIFLLSGLKGEPFADDFADIYDTLLQSLGFRHDSVELQLTRTLEEIMPGSSNWIMHGGIDSFIPIGATISSRLSMGDIIPLTGVLRPEADLGREMTNALGPAYAANMDALEWAGTLADFFLQATGAKPRTMSWENMAVEALRQAPQGQIRAFTEAGMMWNSGQIVDSQGRLTSDNVNAMNVFSRALAFYPLEASKANTAARLNRMHVGYMRGIRQRFVLGYANAYRQGNRDEMARIIDAVNDWNDAVEQTGQEDMRINNFRTAAIRAGRAAESTATERGIGADPDYGLLEQLAGIVNADQERNDE